MSGEKLVMVNGEMHLLTQVDVGNGYLIDGCCGYLLDGDGRKVGGVDFAVDLPTRRGEFECMAMGERYHAVTVCNDCCAGCAGDGKEALCEALGPCRPVARADGKPCIWRMMAAVEDFGVVNNPPKAWFRECEIPY